MKSQESTREDSLQSQGWKKQFTTCEPRLSESVDLYRSIGHEVHLEPLPEEKADDEECRSCLEHDLDRYRTIFTRKLEKGGSDEDDPLE